MAQPMSVDQNTAAEKEKAPKVNVTPPKDFDLDTYIANYTGHSKLLRLLFLANSSKELEVEALKRALDELKKTYNTVLYKDITEKFGDKLGPSYALDRAWMDSTDKKAAQTLDRLDNELTGYKANLIKDSIRNSYNEMGDFHYERGDLNSALKAYVRTRDYCTSSRHIIQMCMNVIKVSIELNNYSHVINYVSKAEQTPELDAVTSAKLKVVAGLAQLDTRKHKMAARKFLEVSPELGTQFSDVLAPQDIAIYGGLLALASFDRQELKKKVLDNQAFKNYLDLVPDVRELIQDFYASRYSSCLNYLTKIRPLLELDVHFHSHVSFVYEKIRSKALIQYFSPYVSVNLNTMAEAFKTTVPALEKELSKLIMESQISARIDSHNKILYARTTDQRSATFEKAVAMGEDYQRNSKALLLRVNFMRNEFYVRPPRNDDDMRDKKS